MRHSLPTARSPTRGRSHDRCVNAFPPGVLVTLPPGIPRTVSARHYKKNSQHDRIRYLQTGADEASAKSPFPLPYANCCECGKHIIVIIGLQFFPRLPTKLHGVLLNSVNPSGFLQWRSRDRQTIRDCYTRSLSHVVAQIVTFLWLSEVRGEKTNEKTLRSTRGPQRPSGQGAIL